MGPSIVEIMNEETRSPSGRVDEGGADSWRAGSQRKTKRYMEPSKQVWR
jgi:hypothetical protein